MHLLLAIVGGPHCYDKFAKFNYSPSLKSIWNHLRCRSKAMNIHKKKPVYYTPDKEHEETVKQRIY